MFWFSLSWNWQIFLGASPLQFHSYHRGFPFLLSLDIYVSSAEKEHIESD